MLNALGQPQSLLLLGGSSEIGLATARRLVRERTRRVHLAGRPSAALTAAADELTALGADVQVHAFDAADTDTHEEVIGKVFAEGDIDLVLLAFGVLGDQLHDEREPMAAVAVARVNYLGGVSSALASAQALRRQGHGALVVLSSVAGERARRDNFIYGSTKAGLDALAQGLGDSLRGSGARVMVVRPGFVRGRMTQGMPEAPLATTPQAVADAILTGLRRGSGTVWVPGALRFVMSGLRHLPRPVFRRLSAR
ncbi:decaprenylphospho-beta-D-erythro-pentofuranosid-2-ulose 2-reductase [Streptacidiphilus sp. PB12-B1b]|uniref:decaprenylphospho-beta-D-erythro-pentofuranosid- 2-ulose 2-reductase n=1 Tax=Streptacidiphilus sp. PB12-B1b TaxID=2705012 RepID=UPI0015FC9DC9|nr:decaprenylphospho-beta-D-erythro-pentofuranosid-2-ulose 2-reductase [Streptacidiphilus sp. PB12-B1b]QMU77689.1 decaprenylphospho-beta-D-erythro-pentofuranosid-2-ulose 2-reductase [Streptacidiphilus sp. PB12-B1b]